SSCRAAVSPAFVDPTSARRGCRSGGRSTLAPVRDPIKVQLAKFLQTRGRPVLEFHPKSEASRSQHFLDLIKRLAPQIGGLQQLGLGALNQVADVVDILRLETVG